MNKYSGSHASLKTALKGLLFFLVFLLIFGCSKEKQVKKEPFFNKWKAMAEQSKGYSPPPLPVDNKIESSDKSAVPTRPAEEQKTKTVSEERKLPGEKITMKMFDVDVPVLLRALARAAGQNIMVNETVKGRTSINIINTPWDQVFKGVLATNGLDFQWEGDIIRIVSLMDLENDTKMMEARAKKASIKKEFDLRMKNLQTQEALAEPFVTKVYHVRFADPEKLRENLEKFLQSAADTGTGTALGENDKGALGTARRGSILVDPHTNSLMIQAVQSDIDRLMQMIAQLDRPTRQVLIEAHIVEATRTTARDLGIQWGGNYQTASGGDINTFGVSSNSGAAAGTLAATSGLTIGWVNTALGRHILNMQLSALQSEGKLNVLSNPSITTLDNQKAIIESGKQVPYQTVENNEVNIEYKDATLKLEVTPYIIDDHTIKLEIDTKNDELDWANAVSGNPAVTTRSAKTKIVLFDGQTTVIGGLNKKKKDESESGVAGLKDIPILGHLFKGQSTDDTTDDLLIFITPHILQQQQPDAGKTE